MAVGFLYSRFLKYRRRNGWAQTEGGDNVRVRPSSQRYAFEKGGKTLVSQRLMLRIKEWGKWHRYCFDRNRPCAVGAPRRMKMTAWDAVAPVPRWRGTAPVNGGRGAIDQFGILCRRFSREQRFFASLRMTSILGIGSKNLSQNSFVVRHGTEGVPWGRHSAVLRG